MNKRNKSILFNETGKSDVLKVVETDIPVPKDTEVLVRVEAVGINRGEISFRDGTFFNGTFPASLGAEACGLVEEVGKGVSKFKVGDRVSAVANFMFSQYSTNHHYAVLGENNLTLLPKGISTLDGASIWASYITSYFAFTQTVNVKPGDIVLVTGATSSSGIGGIQMAQALGAKVIAVTRSKEKLAKLLDFGSDYACTYDNVEEYVKEVTNGNGVNLVYDCVGGSIINTLANCCGFGSTIIIYGVLSKDIVTPFPLMQSMMKGLEMKAFLAFKYSTNPEVLSNGINEIKKLIQSGKLLKKSLIGKVFKGIENIPVAQDYLENSLDNFGKVVVEFN